MTKQIKLIEKRIAAIDCEMKNSSEARQELLTIEKKNLEAMRATAEG